MTVAHGNIKVRNGVVFDDNTGVKYGKRTPFGLS